MWVNLLSLSLSLLQTLDRRLRSYKHAISNRLLTRPNTATVTALIIVHNIAHA